MGLYHTVVIFLLLYCVSNCGCQILTKTRFEKISECVVGLRAKVDRIIFIGTANTSGTDFAKWNDHINFIMRRGAVFVAEYHVDIKACSKVVMEGSYCMFIAADKYKIILNMTAEKQFSNTTVRMIWSTQDFTRIIKSDEWIVPQISDLHAEVNTLQVHYENVTFTKQHCQLQHRKSSVHVQYCCTGSLLPCISKITFRNQVVNGSPCATANVIIEPQSVYMFSHTVCGKDSSTVISCVASKSVALLKTQDEFSSFSGYRNAAIFLASTIAIGLIVATVHRLDASLLFSSTVSSSRTRMEPCSIVRKY